MKFLWEVYSKNAKQSLAKWELFKKRISAKAIILDNIWNIAFITISKGDYFTIPWWWVDSGETIHEGLLRECYEEAWVEVEIIEELWYVIEWRASQDRRRLWKKWREQHSYAYLCKVKWEKVVPKFSPSEKERWFQIEWLPISKVISLFSKAFMREQKEEYNSVTAILERDLLFLETAKKMISGGA